MRKPIIYDQDDQQRLNNSAFYIPHFYCLYCGEGQENGYSVDGDRFCRCCYENGNYFTWYLQHSGMEGREINKMLEGLTIKKI